MGIHDEQWNREKGSFGSFLFSTGFANNLYFTAMGQDHFFLLYTLACTLACSSIQRERLAVLL